MRAAYMAALPEGRESRRELELIPAGEFMMRPHDGRGPYFNRDPEAIIQRTHARGYSLVFDYDHATEMTKETGVPAPASGWITRLFARDGAVWGAIEWTDKAAAAIDAKEYRYYSPVFMHDPDGTVRAIRTAGLTNDPAMFVRALSHANNDWEESDMDLAKLRKALGLATTATEAEVLAAATAAGLLAAGLAELRTAMGLGDDASVTAIATAMTAQRASLKAIATAAGLAEDASAADIETAVKAAAAGGGTDGLKAIAKAAGLAEDASAADIETAVKTAKASAGGNDDPGAFVPRAEFDRLKQDLTSLQQGSAKTAAETAVASAIEAGKVTPASREWALAYAAKDPEGFATFVKDAPAILSNGRVAPSGDPDKGGEVLTEQEKAVCRATGVSEEDFIKSCKAIAAAGQES